MPAQQQQINYGNTANDGQGDPLRTAFIKTDDNFDAIWNAGPVGSNVTILNNTLQVVEANGNLILAANGIGVIQTNTSLVPRFANLYDLGSANLRYRSAYIGSGGLDVRGNLTVGGTYAISNLTVNSISSDDSSFVTVQDGLSVRGDIDTVGIYTDGYFYANGAPFSPGSSYGNAQVEELLLTFNGNILANTIRVTDLIATTVETANIYNQFPLFINTGGYSWEFAGNILYGPDGGTWQSSANTIFLTSPANGYIHLHSRFQGNIVSDIQLEHNDVKINVQNGGPAKSWEFNNDGTTQFPGYTFPYADGNAGEVLKTDGSGGLTWAADTTTYGNANVQALGEAGWSGNIIPSANATYSLGNATNYWSNLWVANNTIYIGGVPLGVSGNVLTVNGEPVLSNDSNTAITTTGNLAAGNILTDNYLYANGEPFVSASTGNITFTDTTMSPPDGADITISAANSEVIIEAFDIRLDATDDLRLTGNDIVSLRNRSTTDPITLRTDYDNNDYVWEFAANGTLTTPGDIVTAGDVTGTAGASTLYFKAQPASNTYIQLNNSVDSVISTVANLEIRTDVSNTAQVWSFATDGSLTAPGAISTTGNITAGNFIGAGANVELVAGDYPWLFDNAGNLTVPGNLIIGPATPDVTFGSLIYQKDGGITIVGTGNNANFSSTITIGWQAPSELSGLGNTALMAFGTIDGNIGTAPVAEIAVGNSTSQLQTWIFDDAGTLTAPGDITTTGNLTANNVNATTSFGLPVYANATVRDSAIASPQPGMMVFVTGTGMQVRGATAWNTIAGTAT